MKNKKKFKTLMKYFDYVYIIHRSIEYHFTKIKSNGSDDMALSV